MSDKDLGTVVEHDGSFADMGLPELDKQEAVKNALDFEAQDAAEAKKAEAEAPEPPKEERAPEPSPEPAEEPQEPVAAAEDEAELTDEERAAKIFEAAIAPPAEPEAPKVDPNVQALENQNRMLQEQVNRMLETMDKAISAPKEPEVPAEPEQRESVWTSPAAVRALQEAQDSGDMTRLASVMAELEQIQLEQIREETTKPLVDQMESDKRVQEAQKALTDRMRVVYGAMAQAAQKSPLHARFVEDFQARDGESLLGKEFSSDPSVLGSPASIVRLIDSMVLDAEQSFGKGPQAPGGQDVVESSAATGRNAGRNRLGKRETTEPTFEERKEELFGKDGTGDEGLDEILAPMT